MEFRNLEIHILLDADIRNEYDSKSIIAEMATDDF